MIFHYIDKNSRKFEIIILQDCKEVEIYRNGGRAFIRSKSGNFSDKFFDLEYIKERYSQEVMSYAIKLFNKIKNNKAFI